MTDTLEQISGLLMKRARPTAVSSGSSTEPTMTGPPGTHRLIDLSELPDLLGARPVRSELIYLLVSLDKQYTAEAPGEPVLQVSDVPHLGCAKFAGRFGAEAIRFVNSRTGRQLRLRGMNARVVVPGAVRLGDLAAKAPAGLTGNPPQWPASPRL